MRLRGDRPSFASSPTPGLLSGGAGGGTSGSAKTVRKRWGAIKFLDQICSQLPRQCGGNTPCPVS